jgi:UDPglucose 6-dehydrogenase
MEDLKRGVTADGRISTWGSYVGIGAGGSCFGKDVQSLIYQLTSRDQDAKLLQSVYDINEYQKVYLLDRAEQEADFSFANKTIAVLGVAFKQRTNDIRDSSGMKVIEGLLGRGVKSIHVYDPMAMTEARHAYDPVKNPLFEKISYHESVKSALHATDALFIATDWEEFRGLSRTIELNAQKPYLVIDGRRMIPDYAELTDQGFRYLAVGSPFVG